ncbi:MAG: CDP-glycerol glycerophosphotransferase family protein [Candidatus Altiarchaeota archaeon]|nr:CDP-glycerol glycerophosphotransferase family protein [Candidatus Altiarchaeota archaeon]
MPKETAGDEFLRSVKNFSHTPIEDGRDLRDILEYDGFSLWWFIEPYLYNRVLEVMKGESNLLISYIRSGSKYWIFVKFVVRCLLGKILRPLHLRRPPCVLVISSALNWRNSNDPQSGKKKKDIMLGDVIATLKQIGHSVITLDQVTTSSGDMKSVIEKNCEDLGTWIPAEAYLSPSIFLKTLRTAQRLKTLLYELKKNRKFVEALRSNGRLLFEDIEEDLNLCFRYHLPKDALYFEMMKKAVDVEKPDIIVVTCEYGSLGLAAIMAGRTRGIPTLALQHGVIHPKHFAYVHAADEVSEDISPRFYPLPDKTAVYGTYDKHVLTEINAYPESSIVVTGQPRYDILAHASSTFSRETTIKKIGLNPDKKLMLWTTQSHGLTIEENRRSFFEVYRTINELSERVQLVIKLHPGETDYRMHKSIADEVGISPVITKDIDIYEIIHACDLMITKASTTGLEAIALNKPVIILNFGGEPDIFDYVKEGVAAGVYRENELKATIERLLEDDSKLAKNRGAYIEKHLYRIDGKATERVVDLIRKMIKS